MVSKNRYLAWPTLFMAINGIINRHPLRTKENASSPWSTLMCVHHVSTLLPPSMSL